MNLITKLIEKEVATSLHLTVVEFRKLQNDKDKPIETIISYYLHFYGNNRHIKNLILINSLCKDQTSISKFAKDHKQFLEAYFNVSWLAVKVKSVIENNVRYIVDMIYVENIYKLPIQDVWNYYFRYKFNNSIRYKAMPWYSWYSSETYYIYGEGKYDLKHSYAAMYTFLHLNDEFIIERCRSIGKNKLLDERELLNKFNSKNIKTIKDVYGLLKYSCIGDYLKYDPEYDTLYFTKNKKIFFESNDNPLIALDEILKNID